MIAFLKKNYKVMLAICLIGAFFYQYFFIQKFRNSYKKSGLYTIGKIIEIKGYGRGAGYNFIYTFNINGTNYESACSIGNLSFSNAEKKIGERYLIIYLKNNIHNNRLYSNIPINDSLNNDIKLQKWVDTHPYIKIKVDSIPSPGIFLQNYF
ncbi:hypothetical protein BAY13_06490 [Elizabethkingia bruuniana]|uniref:hypothetical protein n=1 Tax=Elizabethkingia bruuniana TaxID=1756149 RepID=UPI00099AE619|nr:hypothetical protein [Elizabethkingia bruuniana]OPC62464.1 hypothetical protein BAY13_06490 [Elizabethkingia bruuniana]